MRVKRKVSNASGFEKEKGEMMKEYLENLKYTILRNKITTNWRGIPLTFSIHNSVDHWRASNVNKEPHTLDWIDKFSTGSIFYDIGANIGTYSLYAAKKGSIAYTFEPIPSNCNSIYKNIALNNLAGKITCFPFFLDKHICLKPLDIPIESGNTLMDGNLIKQGILCMSLDFIVKECALPIPDYIKIDVDGNELSVLKGMSELLSRDSIKSMQIELMEENETEALKFLEGFGFVGTLLQTSRAKGKNYYDYHFGRKKIKTKFSEVK